MQDNRIMGFRFKWFVALLLACAIAASAFLPALAQLNSTPDPADPDLRIVSTLTGDGYLELGLNVDSKSDTFQSAGVILTYDPAVLTPVVWDGEETVAEVSVTAATDAETAWSLATVLPTKGADELSGKLAKAVTFNDTGYLFISAEAAKSMPLNQPLPEDQTPDAAPVAGITASGLGISYIAQAVETTPQATTVRFRINDKPVTEPTEPDEGNGEAEGEDGGEATDPETPATSTEYTVEELAASVDLLTAGGADTVATALLVNSLLAIDTRQDELAGVSYIADNTDYTTAGYDSPANLSFVWVQTGVSVNTGTGTGGDSGPADPSDFVNITMFDWDDTMLGSLVIPKGSDATELVKQFVQQRSATAEQLNGGLYYADSSLPFTNKRGYSFDMVDYGVWLYYDSETLTHYDSEVQGVTLPKPTQATGAVDLTQVNDNITMKACYGANPELHTGSGADARYTTSTVSIERVTGDVFIVTIRAKRENIVDGETVGVPRLGKPLVRVQMTSGSTTVPSQVVMSTGDEVVVQTVPSKMVDNCNYTVVDSYQNDNWPNAGIKADAADLGRGTIENNLISSKAWAENGTYTADGFLYEGTLVYINKNLYPGGDTSSINQNVLNDMKLDYSMVSAVPPSTAIRVRNAVGHLKTAFDSLNGITADSPTKAEYQHLTYKQMQYAIANAGALLTENIN